VLINVAVIVIAFNLSNIININPVMLMLFLAAGEGAGLIYAARNQKKVKDLVEAELPQILETMGRVYKVHPDLRVAISEVCKHIKEPLVRERLESIVRLSRFGYTTEEAISVISKELKSSDLDFVVTSIQLNTPLGGNLSGLFERMADILRKRKNTDNEINNVMFQNKISAIISAAFVPFIICLAFVTSENSKKFLIADSTGRLIFFACIIWWLIGVFLIRRVTRIKI
jgi:tight adherence protein B